MATYQGPRGRIGSSNLEVSMTAMDVGQDEGFGQASEGTLQSPTLSSRASP
jgi:hypothetical protein